jgi:predicted amidohydrolase YtcJ
MEAQAMTTAPLSRRQALVLTAAGVYAAARPASLGAAPLPDAGAAETVVLNARVYTVEPGQALPSEAFAIRGDRFVAVGRNVEVRALIGRRTRVVDAAHATIVPGFIDCHNHAVGEDVLYSTAVGNPYEVEFTTIADVVGKLRAKAAGTPPGYWVEGQFFDDTKLKDGRPLDIHDLDGVSTEHPVVVRHRGGHTAFYNSKALELAGIRRDTPNPPGGTFDHDANGELNGRVTDLACDFVDRAGQHVEYSPVEQAERARAGMAYISKQFARYGLTGVHHEHFDHPALALRAVQEIRERGELMHRVYFNAYGALLDELIASGVQTGLGDEWLRIGGSCEHTVDGSFSERTMALSRPYPGSASGYRGNLVETQDVLDAWALRMLGAGMRINCHANGDVAIGEVLTALERASASHDVRATRPQITHCTYVNDGLVARIRALGVVPAPFTTYAYYNTDKFHFYGPEIIDHCMAYRSFIDGGVVAAAGSDFPPGPFAPLMGIQGMVTRRGWNGETWGATQKITVAEALRINTWNGAYASREEHLKGSIAPGKLADYVMLAEDPHAADPEHIKDIRILKTVAGGRTVHEA